MRFKNLISQCATLAIASAIAVMAAPAQADAQTQSQWRNLGDRASQHQAAQRSNVQARREATPRQAQRPQQARPSQTQRPQQQQAQQRTTRRAQTPQNRNNIQNRNRATPNRNVQSQRRPAISNNTNRNIRNNNTRRPDIRRDYRPSQQRWDTRWRNNTRYDWQRYRSQNRTVFRLGAYSAPYRNYTYSRVPIGFRIDSLFLSSRYQIAEPWRYRLPDVYGPYRWVRYYDDVLLVDIYSGEVVDVIYDFFW